MRDSQNRIRRFSAPRATRGAALIVTLWIVLGIAALSLLFARSARVETLAAANEVAAMQADATAKGALQYLISYLDGLNGLAPAEGEVPSEAVSLGDGYFWIMRPPGEDETGYSFGPVDESSRLNLNAAWLTPELMMNLPNMTSEAAACIVAWRNPAGAATPEGAESDYYLSLPEPYNCKDSLFETMEELLLVKGVTPELLYGLDANRNGVLEDGESNSEAGPVSSQADGRPDCGIYGLATCYSAESVTQRGRGGQRSSQVVRGALNVNTAQRPALLCLPGLTSADVDAIIAYRAGAGVNLTDVNWVARAVTANKATPLVSGNVITVRSYQYSADILAVSADGRAFRRYRAVLDTLNSSPPKVIYWKELTSLGWPLSPEIRSTLRAGGDPLNPSAVSSRGRSG